MKEMVEDTRKDMVGKTIGVMTEVDGKATSLAMHLHGTHSNRCIRLTVDGMMENGKRLHMTALITVVLTLGRAVGTLGMDLMGTHGPVDNGNEGKEKGRREINILLLTSPRERTGARARTGTETITRRPRGGHLETTMKIGAHGRAASFISPICRT